MKILFLDIETAPHIVFAWGLWQQDIAISQIVKPGHTLCWAAKWQGKKKVLFDSVHRSKPKKMLENIHHLLCEADAVCHWNGNKFDMPTLNKEFIENNILPPDPYKNIDLLPIFRKEFKFPSNKLDYIAQQLGIGKKLPHKGMDLWRECMDGDDKAWRTMERYNKQDVRLLDPLYLVARPWIRIHPNAALYIDSNKRKCRVCGSENVHSRGTEKTLTQIYERYQCQDCGKWQRGNKTIKPKEKVVMV